MLLKAKQKQHCWIDVFSITSLELTLGGMEELWGKLWVWFAWTAVWDEGLLLFLKEGLESNACKNAFRNPLNYSSKNFRSSWAARLLMWLPCLCQFGLVLKTRLLISEKQQLSTGLDFAQLLLLSVISVAGSLFYNVSLNLSSFFNVFPTCSCGNDSLS